MPVINGTGEHLEDVVQNANKDMRELGRELHTRAEDIRKETVKTLHNAAETIRKEAREATQDNGAHKTADEVAKGLDKAAHYLQSHSVDQMGAQATRVVRQNAMQIAIVALVIGLLLGIVLRGNADKK